MKHITVIEYNLFTGRKTEMSFINFIKEAGKRRIASMKAPKFCCGRCRWPTCGNDSLRNPYLKPSGRTIQCTGCNLWFHVECAKISVKVYNQHKNDVKKIWLCNSCS